MYTAVSHSRPLDPASYYNQQESLVGIWNTCKHYFSHSRDTQMFNLKRACIIMSHKIFNNKLKHVFKILWYIMKLFCFLKLSKFNCLMVKPIQNISLFTITHILQLYHDFNRNKKPNFLCLYNVKTETKHNLYYNMVVIVKYYV